MTKIAREQNFYSNRCVSRRTICLPSFNGMRWERGGGGRGKAGADNIGLYDVINHLICIVEFHLHM